MLGSHGFAYKGYYCYDEVVQVPLILRAPGITREDTACNDLVNNVDILPTLLELIGVDVPEGVEGKPITFREGRPITKNNEVFLEVDVPGGVGIKMVRTKKWKYCFNWRPKQVDELYDLEHDPHEMSNLISSKKHYPIIRELREKLSNWDR
jgi:arylsulfatase A-like enzyme